MISPSTPPGTKIVCIDVDPFELVVNGLSLTEDVAGRLTLGQEYTLDAIEPVKAVIDGVLYPTRYVLASVQEITEIWENGKNIGFLSHRFRRRDLPESLTRLQTALRKPAPALG